ncbi:MAG: phosphopentomutase, partial [Bacilli bacterium]
SGTEIIEQYGEEHQATGDIIVYTSADSVLQIAAHEETVPLAELYRICEIAREMTLTGDVSVVRVIARPFIGLLGAYKRTSNRKDYSVKPPEPTVLDHLKNAGLDIIAIGKISDKLAEEGITQAIKTKSNDDGITKTIEVLHKDFRGLAFTNLVDFDSLYGHRRDPGGYADALEAFDQRLPEILTVLRDDDLLIITADHGNDPLHTGTDHTREYVPLLVYSKKFSNDTITTLGVRKTFSDIGATIADNFNTKKPYHGNSFLPVLK